MLERFSLFQSILHRKEKHFQFSFAHCCICQLYAFQQQVFTKVVCSVYAMDMISSPNISNNYVATFIENEPNFFSFLESSPHGVPLSCMELPSQPASPHLAYSVNGGSVGSHNRDPAKLASSLRHCSVILGTFVSVIARSFLCSHFLLQSRTCQGSCRKEI